MLASRSSRVATPFRKGQAALTLDATQYIHVEGTNGTTRDSASEGPASGRCETTLTRGFDCRGGAKRRLSEINTDEVWRGLVRSNLQPRAR